MTSSRRGANLEKIVPTLIWKRMIWLSFSMPFESNIVTFDCSLTQKSGHFPSFSWILSIRCGDRHYFSELLRVYINHCGCPCSCLSVPAFEPWSRAINAPETLNRLPIYLSPGTAVEVASTSLEALYTLKRLICQLRVKIGVRLVVQPRHGDRHSRGGLWFGRCEVRWSSQVVFEIVLPESGRIEAIANPTPRNRRPAC